MAVVLIVVCHCPFHLFLCQWRFKCAFNETVCSASPLHLSSLSLLFPSFLGEPCSTLVPCRGPSDHAPCPVFWLLFLAALCKLP